MRKITLFLMSLFLTVGAMAQAITIEDGKLYRIKENRWPDKYLTVRSYNQVSNGQFGTVPFLDKAEGNENQVFFIEATDGGYYLKSKSGYYITHRGWCIDACDNGSKGKVAFVADDQTTESLTDFHIKNVDVPGKFYKVELIGTQKGESTDTPHPFCDVNWNGENFATFNLEVVDESEFVRTAYVHNTGSMNRNPGEERGLTTFTLTDGTNSLEVSNIQDASSRTAPVYVDKSSVKFTTKQGATLKFTDFSYTGSWMHAYAYIDYNNDYKFNLTNNNNGEGEGEIVSYNYYDGNDITGTPANQGSAIGNTYGESKAMPAFTLPRNLPAGEYRVRIKIDWNNLDADYGASDIAANGGCQCDFTIVVEEAEGNEIAWNALNNAVDEALALFDAVKIGTSVGSYSSSIDGYEAEFNDIMSYKSSITEDTPADEIDAKTARVREIIASFSLNMPKAGDYIRIKSIEGWNDDARYLSSVNTTVEGKTERAAFVAEAGANTIFYFDGENLISYASGNYLVNNSSFAGYNGVQTDGTVVEFRTSNNTSNRHAYNISFKGNDNATRWLYTNAGNFTDAGSSCGTEGGYNFNLEPVTELPVTVTAAGYATFYAPVAVTVPAGVTAHTVTINGEWATLSEALTVVPAETGVVLVAGEGSHNFAITTTDATAASALVGTTAATYIAADAYVLSNGTNGVGFYGAKLNQQGNTAFLNNSHKAYLPMTDGVNAASYSFRFPGTTGVENVVVENEVKAIYDLTGRRVSEITEAGIYIIGGKKVLVK